MDKQQARCFKILGQQVPEYTSEYDKLFRTSSSEDDSGSGASEQNPSFAEDNTDSQRWRASTADEQEGAEEQKSGSQEYHGIIDPMDIKLNRNLRRPTTEDRLRKFQMIQQAKKRRKRTEHEMREIASKKRAEKMKAEVLHILEWYFIEKLAENRMEIFEAEKIIYGRQKLIEKKKLEEEEQKLRGNIDKSIENRLNKEIIHQSRMKKELFEHEILQAAESTEILLKNKYQNDMLKLKFCELRENYQMFMNDYCVFWKKKAYVFNNIIENIKCETNRSIQFYEDQRTLECLLAVESKWRKKAKESWKGNVQMVKSLLEILVSKEDELTQIQEENEKLERNIGQWKNILPSVLDQMKQFVKLTIKENAPEVLNLLKTLNKLYEFTDITPEKVDIPKKENIGKDILDDMEILNEDEIPNEETNKMNELDYRDQLLLKIKQIILDSLKIVRSYSPSKRKPEFLRKQYINKKQYKKERKKMYTKSLIKKMTEIIEASDLIFEISGAKYSSPDIENHHVFIAKREKSLKKILNESNLVNEVK